MLQKLGRIDIMPIYTYRCTNKKCGHEFERLQSVKTPNVTLCEKCKSLAKRIIVGFSGPAVYTK